jgi:hypothetical protein
LGFRVHADGRNQSAGRADGVRATLMYRVRQANLVVTAEVVP